MAFYLRLNLTPTGQSHLVTLLKCNCSLVFPSHLYFTSGRSWELFLHVYIIRNGFLTYWNNNLAYPSTVISADSHSLEFWEALWETRFRCAR